MKFRIIFWIFFFFCVPSVVIADSEPIQNRDDFVLLLDNRALKRPLIELMVSPDGYISGRAVMRDVSGHWEWVDGYFCRTLKWGRRDLGYNCQSVEVIQGKIRFTSDKGTGDFADFALK